MALSAIQNQAPATATSELDTIAPIPVDTVMEQPIKPLVIDHTQPDTEKNIVLDDFGSADAGLRHGNLVAGIAAAASQHTERDQVAPMQLNTGDLATAANDALQKEVLTELVDQAEKILDNPAIKKAERQLARTVQALHDKGISVVEASGNDGIITSQLRALGVPVIAGLVADLYAINPTLTPTKVATLLQQATQPNPDTANALGAGLINPDLARELARNA